MLICKIANGPFRSMNFAIKQWFLYTWQFHSSAISRIHMFEKSVFRRNLHHYFGEKWKLGMQSRNYAMLIYVFFSDIDAAITKCSQASATVKTFLARSHLAPTVSSLAISAIKCTFIFPTSSRRAQWYTFIKRSRAIYLSWEQARAAFVTTSLFQSWTKENRKWFGGRREQRTLDLMLLSHLEAAAATPKAKLIHFPLFPCCSSHCSRGGPLPMRAI